MQKRDLKKKQERKEPDNKSNIIQDIYAIYLNSINDNIKKLQ